ncbi:MAG: fumarylacetoacetate hydrolase family protein [Candidatus Eisenbacteria bacterium]|uniref:Fumarylacetoacetate hydrolase family protein n=1 Tax=Eiseniibacteriota bacterium TaxID=2212470 RepID=A0A937X6G3_UNCEI|nr:fumarylacetoacetate hydrolase family protein [Candidatus Eisenbacteria bacterium]
MRWLSFGPPGGERPGVMIEPGVLLDIAACRPHWPRDWAGLLAANLLEEVRRLAAEADFSARHTRPLAGLPLAPPVPRPSKVIALGRNYPAHAAEQQRRAPDRPLLFAKAPSCLIGQGCPVVVPARESRPDYEGEMALVVGRPLKDIPEERALEGLAGVTVFNDVSGREAQFGDKLWLRGKSFDTFGPIGPWAVTLDEVGDPDDLRLRTRVNGETRQDARTAEMTVSCAGIVAYVSAQMTLLPGDVIATGTPAGVGVFRDPPLFLQDGDIVEIELQGVGVLRNPVVRPTPPRGG